MTLNGVTTADARYLCGSISFLLCPVSHRISVDWPDIRSIVLVHSLSR